MRTIVISVCIFAAACSGHDLNTPAAPTSVAFGPAQSQARSGRELPFRGSFTGAGGGAVNCPPTCPPTTLTITTSQTGEATHLGRFTAESVDVVDLATNTSTGTWNFTAANGDQLFTTTIGAEQTFVPPNISHVTLIATITNGTGRFVAATGTLTIRLTETIDFASDTGSRTGSFEGQLNLNK